MINVAIVGYEGHIKTGGKDIITNLIPDIIKRFKGLRICHTDIIERREGRPIEELVDEMIRSGTDVLHYVNFRDPYNSEPVDRHYIKEVLRKSEIPVLLTSAHPDAESFAEELGISFLSVPFRRIDDYPNKIKGLAQGK